MAWLETHQSLQRHPKTNRLCRTLAISTPTAIGHLLCLWWWCVDYAPDGGLCGYEPEDIADAAMWEGDPAVFFDALLSVGFLEQSDEGVLVHDWDEYGGRLNDIRERNRDRQRRFRERHRDQSVPYNTDNGHVTVTNALVTGLQDTTQQTGHNTTGQDRTGQTDNGAVAPAVVAPSNELDPRIFEVLDVMGEARTPNNVKYVGIKIRDHPMINPVAAALEARDHISKSRKAYKKPLVTWANWMKNDEKPPPWDTGVSLNGNGATPNGKHELASDGREYGTGRNPSYVRPETPIPSTIPEVRSLFQALKSFGTTSMREWDDLLTLNPHVRDGTIIFPTPDEGARATAQRYVHDIDMACRERNLRFEIRGDA